MISIILPVHRLTSMLPRCLDSILQQDFADWELIIVSGYSAPALSLSEDTLADPRILHLSLEHDRLGPSYARNIGMSYARANYLLFADHTHIGQALCLF